MKPFLKYPGGKSRLADRILTHLAPRDADTQYFEPFCGSGAVALDAMSKRLFAAYRLSDTNVDVVDLFQSLQTCPDTLIDTVESLFEDFSDTAENYYELRRIFNDLRHLGADSSRPVTKCAYFLWLNRHCFNGLVRYSKAGGFNVPHGERARPPMCPTGLMRGAAKLLRENDVTIQHQDFAETLLALHESERTNCVVYCDPPYVQCETTARHAPTFNAYAATPFRFDHHAALATICGMLRISGIACVVSNHDTPESRDLYANARIVSFDVNRNISAQSQYRQSAREILAVYEPQQTLQQAA